MPSPLPEPPQREDVECTGARLIGENYGRLLNFQIRHKRFDGSWTPLLSRDCFDSGAAVVVLPYEPETDRVVLVKQFRMGPWLTGHEPWIYECPAGRLDKAHASAKDTARMETEEEAGLAAIALFDMGGFFTSPGIFTEHSQLFCARVAGIREGTFGLDVENEDILATAFTAEAAVALALEGRIVSGPTLACLLKFAALKAKIRQAWT